MKTFQFFFKGKKNSYLPFSHSLNLNENYGHMQFSDLILKALANDCKADKEKPIRIKYIRMVK